MNERPVAFDADRVELTTPLAMPQASAFLWNRRMMLQISSRGFATGQHLQPEPARYAHAPVLEASTFMQPELPYYAHHPGRFVYVKDEEAGTLFSLPYEPVRRPPRTFRFSAGPADLRWDVTDGDLRLRFGVRLPVDDAVELWTLELHNDGDRPRRLSLYPYFPIGYMSWMNQSASYRPELGGVVARSVTPYQRVEDYARVRRLRDLTFLLHDAVPDAWETSQSAFEGEGGLRDPDGVRATRLGRGEADYELPVAALQYRLELSPGSARQWRFLFGPALDDGEIVALRARYLRPGGFEDATAAYSDYLAQGEGVIRIETPDPELDHFVNHVLGRQLHYHGELNRLTTDPQTRNYLQDAMGMVYIRPERCRAAVLRALASQRENGALPDGILLDAEAELKYINQVPHSDHCVWLPLCLEAYLDETGDFGLLDASVSAADDPEQRTVFERVTRALDWLAANRDARGLSLIAQGDWCDPMNMVGHKGRGVSGWLSLATVHALRCWIGIAETVGKGEAVAAFSAVAEETAAAVQRELWDGDWFARGITDDGARFGIRGDREGSMYLNPQSWALLAGVETPDQRERMIAAVRERLEGPHGVAMLDPPYTRMREDIGRLTQKYPGSAENGSVYNHAAAFYVQALFQVRRPEDAFRVLRLMIPGPDPADYLQRGQLPAFLPNYYRGDWRRRPRTAGRSSQLVNTGTVAWFYRIVVESLFGLRGCAEGLRVDPQLPSAWERAEVRRRFRGADFEFSFVRAAPLGAMRILVDGREIEGRIIRDFEPGRSYRVQVELPERAP